MRNATFWKYTLIIAVPALAGGLCSLLLFKPAIGAGKASLFQKTVVNSSGTNRSGRTIRIRLAGGEFDPLFQTSPVETGRALLRREYLQGKTGYYLVQFDGPIRAAQKGALERLGARVLDYIPDFTFVVKMDDTTRALADSLQGVRWIGMYQPAYRLGPSILRSAASGKGSPANEYIVTLFRGEDQRAIARRIELLGADVLAISETDFKTKLKIQRNSADLEAVAALNGVRWMEVAPDWRLSNDIAAGIMGVSDVQSSLNLFGSGQIVAVADSGLDAGDAAPANLHDDFEDGSGNSRVSQIFDRVGDGAADVNSGHGTHVAGSVLGNGSVSGSDPVGGDYSNSYAGMAPEAALVFQALEDNNSGTLSGIPLDLTELFSQAYDVDARIHTNSWGSAAAGAYTSFSEDVDRFVWEHSDFLIIFSAGNESEDADGDHVIDLNTIDMPATAKNCITVGATENLRPSGSSPTPGYDSSWFSLWPIFFPDDPIASDHVSDNADGLAAFSSRGPTMDERFKPDILAPGTNIISTKSSLTANGSLWGKGGLGTSGPDAQYIYSGGTSMATPLVTGAATLVREFYTDIEGITPSAALIKATLLNAAVDIAPGQYGIGSAKEIPDPPRPNNVEGWGRLSVLNAIAPAAPKIGRYDDETNGLNTGDRIIYDFTLGDETVPLNLMLVWNDYPGSPVAGGGLVNDLDLTLIDPDSNVNYPNNADQRPRTQKIAYDDEGYENAWRFSVPDLGFGVKYTPAAYPAVLDKIRFYLRTTQDNSFDVYVWDDDGPGGLPGTMLMFTEGKPPYLPSGGWYTMDIPDAQDAPQGAIITEGSFYVELRYRSTADFNPFLALDESNPNNRSFVYDGTTWSSLPYSNIAAGDLAIQAVVAQVDDTTSADRVNNVVGIDIQSPKMGAYTIRVDGYNIPQGPQPFAVVVTGGDISDLTKTALQAEPSNLTAVAVSTSQINLNWTDNSTSESGFKIERKAGSDGTYSEITTVAENVTSYSDPGLNRSTTYFYRVRAYNAAGNSSYSNESSATTATQIDGSIPDPPKDLLAIADSRHQIALSWTDHATDELGFKIERRVGYSGSFNEIATVGADIAAYSDTRLSEPTTYFYRVRAYNTAGNSNYSNEASATTPDEDDISIPAGPEDLSANAVSAARIDIAWTDISTDELGFKIERKVGTNGTYVEIASAGADINAHSDSGLSASTAYFYRVRAYNSLGDSEYSNQANDTTFAAVDSDGSGSSGGGGGGGGGGVCFITAAAGN